MYVRDLATFSEEIAGRRVYWRDGRLTIVDRVRQTTIRSWR